MTRDLQRRHSTELVCALGRSGPAHETVRSDGQGANGPAPRRLPRPGTPLDADIKPATVLAQTTIRCA